MIKAAVLTKIHSLRLAMTFCYTHTSLTLKYTTALINIKILLQLNSIKMIQHVTMRSH